jgi:hypothetical protein
MNRLTALITLFRRGSMVADPALWKTRQIEATSVAAVIVAALHALEAFGYALPMDADTATAVAVGLIALVNWVLTLTTTDKIGLPPVGDAPPLPPAGPVHGDGPDYRG